MAERLRVHTTGAHAVENTWQRFVPSARLDRVDPQRFAFGWSSASTPGMSVIEYELRATVRSSVHPSDQIMVCRMVADDGGAWDADGALDSREPWIADEQPVSARWDGRARVQALVFDRPVAERLAREMTGDPSLQLHSASPRPIDTAAAARWQHSFRYVADALTSEQAADSPLLEAELRRHALHASLAAFSGDFLASLERGAQTRAAPATVRRALAFIDAHAHEPITIDDIAAAAGITPRGLQYAFQRALGVSPTQRLRQVRLAAAHADLQDPSAGSVREIAARWGFSHGARFAAQYRHTYGANPGHTLRVHR